METNTNITQEQLETIESYLNNTMKNGERATFEKQLETDPNFKLMLEDVKGTLLGIEAAALKEKLDDFHSEMIPVRKLSSENSSKTTKSSGSRIFQLLIAASIVLAFGLFYFMNQASPSEKLFAKHFKVDPGLPTTMSTSTNYNFYDGMVNYKREEYTIAIEKWEGLLAEKPQNDTLNYFLGVANLANGNAEKASAFLSEATKINSSIFIEEAYYYAALAEIKKGNNKTAIEILSKSKSPQSLSLLDELK